MPTTDPDAICKYHRPMRFDHEGQQVTVWLDVYDILALSKRNVDGTLRPARPSDAALDHALKKLLCPGQRGVKGVVQDLIEARQAMDRAIELELAENA